jgi:hypothetical protein
MTLIDTLKDVFNLAPPRPEVKIFNVTSASHYEGLPDGFFRVETASGETSLGYKGVNALSWNVGTTVVDGSKRVTLTVPRSDLPLVKLDFRRQEAGIHHHGGMRMIDTDSLEEWDGTVGYGDEKMREGVDYI